MTTEAIQDVVSIVLAAMVLGVLYVSGKYVYNYARPILKEFLVNLILVARFKYLAHKAKQYTR